MSHDYLKQNYKFKKKQQRNGHMLKTEMRIITSFLQYKLFNYNLIYSDPVVNMITE